MDLIKQLTDSLGVEEGQARGGLGLILQKAQAALSEGDFGKLKGMIPDTDALMGEAPETGGGSSGGLMGGGLMGMVAGAADKLGLDGVGDMAELTAGFDKLGLSADQLGGFVTQILEFVEKIGGAEARAMIEKFLKP